MDRDNNSDGTIDSSVTDWNHEISPSSPSSSSSSPSSSSTSSSTSSSASNVSHPNVPDLVQYRIQRFLHDPTISTISVSQTLQTTEQLVVQDAKRRVAAQLQTFDVAFHNAAASASSNTHAIVDDSSNTEASIDSNTSDADDKPAEDENKSG